MMTEPTEELTEQGSTQTIGGSKTSIAARVLAIAIGLHLIACIVVWWFVSGTFGTVPATGVVLILILPLIVGLRIRCRWPSVKYQELALLTLLFIVAVSATIWSIQNWYSLGMHRDYVEERTWTAFERELRKDRAFQNITVETKNGYRAGGTLESASDLRRLIVFARRCGINDHRLGILFFQGIRLRGGHSWLDSLDVMDIPPNDSDLRELSELKTLEILRLSSGPITTAGLENLKSFPHLKELFLDNTQVSGSGLKHLNWCTSLRILVLSKTRVDDAGLEHMKGLSNLERLVLDGTQITDAGLEHLKGLTALSTLDLMNTQTTSEGRTILRASLPKCTIEPNP